MNTTTKILIGIGILSVSGAIFYFFKKSSNESEQIDAGVDEKQDEVETPNSIDEELMSPEDQELLDNLEADNSLPSTSEPNNGNDNEVRPVETRRTRTDIGDKTSSGTRSSLNPRTNTRSSRSSRTRSSSNRSNRR